MKPPLDRSPARSIFANADRSLKKGARRSNFQGVTLKRLRKCWSVRWPGDASVRRRILVALCVLVTTSVGLHSQPTIDFGDASSIPLGDEPIAPVPRNVSLDAGKVRLGEMLFHDVRLSRGDMLACASCHVLAEGGDDNRARGPGLDGELLNFNAATVFNTALSFRFNWRGNFRTLEQQNEAVLLDRHLMNTTWQELLAKLRADAAYRDAFATVYGGDVTPAHVLDALATFQRSLTTPDARFDRYLRGEQGAITPEEERGYQLFKEFGCVACHQGMNVGGNLFQRFGIFHDPFAQWPIHTADLGRFTITGEAKDRFVFRVPSLRNVAVTAPYFHDGRAQTLEEAIVEMARSQLGRVLIGREIDQIASFLRTLTGEYRGRPLSDRAGSTP
jgi:cytochrome c peroxidase